MCVGWLKGRGRAGVRIRAGWSKGSYRVVKLDDGRVTLHVDACRGGASFPCHVYTRKSCEVQEITEFAVNKPGPVSR